MRQDNGRATEIHTVLCALVPLGLFFLCYRAFGFSFNVAAAICFVTGVVSMVALLPLTAIIYGIFVRRGRPNDGTIVHSTDAGCTSLIVVALFLLLFPTFEKARQSAMERRKVNAMERPQKPMK